MKNTAGSNSKLPYVSAMSECFRSGDAKIQSEMYLLVVLRTHESNQLLRVRFGDVWGLQLCFAPHLCMAVLLFSHQMPTAAPSRNQNTSHSLALTISLRHCLLNSSSLNRNLKSPPTTWEQNPDTDR